jgi:hypothetical protein
VTTCNYCGKQTETGRTHCEACGTELPTRASASAEQSIDFVQPKYIDVEQIDAAFDFVDGFHRADWKQITQWIEANVSALDRGEAWNEAALLWVRRVRDDLGGNYFLLQSPTSVLLCDQPLETAQWLLDYAGKAAETISQYLSATAWQGAVGKHVALVFSDDDDYYQYLSYHSLDGKQAASGGVCIHSGYSHVAMPWHNASDAANALIHELTHDCLSYLPLPLWLNEGIAVTLEKLVGPPPRWPGLSDQDVWTAAINWRPPLMWDELAERHFGFWTEQTIQTFWAGTSFYEPGDASQLSYSLAEVFVKLLSERGDGGALRAFIEAARQDDAGQTAAMDILGADLGEIAGTFLGEGNWRPQRKAMIACWEDSGWTKRQNEAPG